MYHVFLVCCLCLPAVTLLISSCGVSLSLLPGHPVPPLPLAGPAAGPGCDAAAAVPDRAVLPGGHDRPGGADPSADGVRTPLLHPQVRRQPPPRVRSEG